MEIERAGDLCAGSPRIRPCQHKHCIMWGIYKKLRITVDSFLLSLFFFFNCKSKKSGRRETWRKSRLHVFSAFPPHHHLTLC